MAHGEARYARLVVEDQRFARAQRARRAGAARCGGARGKGAVFFGPGDRDIVQRDRRTAVGKDVQRGAAGNEDGGGGRGRYCGVRAKLERQADRAAVGEHQSARAAIAAADEAQRRARKGVPREQAKGGVDPAAEPVAVRKPGQKAGDRDIGRRIGQRVDRRDQAAGSAIGGGPCRVEIARRPAHRIAARDVGAGEMVVAG